MDIKLIIDINRRDTLEAVEQKLKETGVEGINVTRIKGYGEYHDFFAQDWMVEEVRLEIFTKKNEVEKIATAIMGAAHTGVPGDGVVAIVPVEKFFLIRTRAEATPQEFLPRSGS